MDLLIIIVKNYHKFIEKKNIEKNFRQIVRTFLYLCREFIVAQPLSSFAQEKIDGNKYKKWLKGLDYKKKF